MAKPTHEERVRAWQQRVAESTREVYGPWADKYRADMLEQYFYGHQTTEDVRGHRGYVINLFYPSIKISMPEALFKTPKFAVKAKNTRTDDPQSDAVVKAKLQEDTLNTITGDPDFGFQVEANLALLDAQFRFGVVEVGYTADFTENPLVGRPMLRDDGTEMADAEGKPVAQPDVVMSGENTFMKWIPASQFRVSLSNHNRMAKCDWVGYYEWLHIEDVQANRAFKNTSGLTATGRYKMRQQDPNEEKAPPGMVKVWRIWDLRAKTKRTFAEGWPKFLQEKPFKFVPLAILKFDEILGQFLPLPPTFNWMPPQDELNETREMQRVHRRRFKRRYLRRAGAFDTEEEFRKLQSGEDGQSAEVNGDPSNALVPVQDAPLDSQIVRNIPQTEQDFTRISGISGESQQVAQSETATQANLIALAGQVRESYKRSQVASWCAEIGRLLLMTIRENMALPFWIKRAVDPQSPMAGEEAMEVAYLWREITTEELGDMDSEVSVDLSGMSPAEADAKRDKWLAFLNLIQTPGIGMLLMASPSLMRKTAAMFDITDERDLRDIANAVQANVMMQALASGGGGAAPPGKPGEAAPGPTPTNNDTAQQLETQLPVEVRQ